nr:hypothetical protein [uncultured Acetatifactor sp.]
MTSNREKATIIQIADVHLNYTNAAVEADDEVMYTKQCRSWSAVPLLFQMIFKSRVFFQWVEEFGALRNTKCL